MTAHERPVEAAGSMIDTRTPAGAVEIRVLLFAQAREAAGVGERTLRVPREASVSDAAELLSAAHPALAQHLERCSFAINERYARREERLQEGDELAVIPPVAGG